MRISTCNLYKFGLLLLVISLLAPKINIVSGFNITLLDLFPFYFLLYVLLLDSKNKVFIKTQNLGLLFVIFLVVVVMFLSTIHGFFLFQDLLGFIKSVAQFYRRFVVLILIPLFILTNPCIYTDVLNYFSKYFIFLTIFTGIVGLFINFNKYIHSLYFNYITNSKQVFLFGLYRNMGLIGEASYFADMVVFSLILLFLLKKYFSKMHFFIIFTILILILISTVSKSSIISTIFALFVLFNVYIVKFALKKEMSIKINLYLIIIILMSFSVSMLLFLYIKPWMNQIFVLAESSLKTRTDVMWDYFLNVWLNYRSAFFLGFGFKGLKSYFVVAGAHNQYLGFLIDFGVIFSAYILIALLFLVPSFIYRSIPKNYRYIYFFIILFIISYLAMQSLIHEPLYHFQVLGTYISILLILYTDLRKYGQSS